MVHLSKQHRNFPMKKALTKSSPLNLNSFITKRDFIGALAMLDFGQREHFGPLSHTERLLWIGYCAFRLGNLKRCKEVYLELLSGKYEDVDQEIALYLACVYYGMGLFTDAKETAISITIDSELKNRILLHVARKSREESNLVKYRQQLHYSKEDKLSAAAVEFSFYHRFQETATIYKQFLVEDPDDLALNVYVAMCYFKMDYYDVSLEVLSIYCQSFPDSAVAANLKACNMFRLCNGKAALDVLESNCSEKTRDENDLIRHNIVVFSEGEKALQILPPLVDKIPEARLNLAIFYLQHGEIEAAAELMDGIEPNSTHAHIVLGILYTKLAQTNSTLNAITKAQSHFQIIGNASTECDTIPGRQCMASCFFLLKQFEDVIIYLDSIRAFLDGDDNFNWNYGISLAATGKYDKGLKALLQISNEAYRSELAFNLWLAKCYIICQFPDKAWECYLRTDDVDDSYEILRLIANECYKIGDSQFLFSARAFDKLFKANSFPTYLEGMIAASIGYFRYILLNKSKAEKPTMNEEDSENFMEVLDILESSDSSKCEKIAHSIRSWTIQNKVSF